MSKKVSNMVRCGFCGLSRKDTGLLIEGNGYCEDSNDEKNKIYVCEGCIKICLENFKKEQDKKSQKPDSSLKQMIAPTPKELVAHLDNYVIGQTSCKRKLAVEVANHFQRLFDTDENGNSSNPLIRGSGLSDVVIEKSNIVLIGPTGSGKTLMAKSLASKLKVPLAIGDATTLTEAGYVGEDVENLLHKLLIAANFDVELAQRGIIYIDEIDKLRSTGGNVSITRDVSGQGVQQSLLKLIEGTIANVPPNGGRKHPEQQCIQIDTTNILFIVGGSFVGIEDIVAKRLNKSGGMGFHAMYQGDQKEKYNELMSEIIADDLEQFGLIPELVGRLPVIATLEELDAASMKRILTEPKNALLKQEQKKMLRMGIGLTFSDDAIEEIVEQAMKKMTGARALRSVVADFMTDIYFDIDKEHKGKKIVVDRDVVKKITKVITPQHSEAA